MPCSLCVCTPARLPRPLYPLLHNPSIPLHLGADPYLRNPLMCGHLCSWPLLHPCGRVLLIPPLMCSSHNPPRVSTRPPCLGWYSVRGMRHGAHALRAPAAAAEITAANLLSACIPPRFRSLVPDQALIQALQSLHSRPSPFKPHHNGRQVVVRCGAAVCAATGRTCTCVSFGAEIEHKGAGLPYREHECPLLACSRPAQDVKVMGSARVGAQARLALHSGGAR